MAWLSIVFTTYLFAFYFLPLFQVTYYALVGFCRNAGVAYRGTSLALNTMLVLASTVFYDW
jgi:hypothetical protein